MKRMPPHSKRKSLIDLFAGCGGLSLGMEQAGFMPVFANEIWDVAAETYRRNRNLSESQMFVGDVKYLVEHFADFPIPKNVALICGGPPCSVPPRISSLPKTPQVLRELGKGRHRQS